MDAVGLLLRLVLASGHAATCMVTKVPCTCAKSADFRLAHGEACSLLRDMGLLK